MNNIKLKWYFAKFSIAKLTIKMFDPQQELLKGFTFKTIFIENVEIYKQLKIATKK